MVSERRLSIKKACNAAGLSRAAYYKVPALPQEKDAEVIDALNGVVEKNGRWGFWKCCDRLRLDGHPWNHKRLWRVYCQLRLNLPRRTKKRLPLRLRQPLVRHRRRQTFRQRPRVLQLGVEGVAPRLDRLVLGLAGTELDRGRGRE